MKFLPFPLKLGWSPVFPPIGRIIKVIRESVLLYCFSNHKVTSIVKSLNNTGLRKGRSPHDHFLLPPLSGPIERAGCMCSQMVSVQIPICRFVIFISMYLYYAYSSAICPCQSTTLLSSLSLLIHRDYLILFIFFFLTEVKFT